MNPVIWILAALCVWNLIVFFLYGIDKAKAKRGAWRIPEKTLIGCALLFGGPGAFLGMQVFRHKTKHTSFRILVPIGLIITIAAAVLLVTKGAAL